MLEINLDDDQIDDAIDDALQYFRERHFNGAERMYLKHEFTADDVTRFTTQMKLLLLLLQMQQHGRIERTT